MDRPPVHELSAVNGHSLRFKYRATASSVPLLPKPLFSLGVRLTPSMQGEAAGAAILWCARQLSASHKMCSVHREFLLGLCGRIQAKLCFRFENNRAE